VTSVRLPAGRVCGSGFDCQRQCCHYPRLLSFVEEGIQRAFTRKVARRSIGLSGSHRSFGSTGLGLRRASLQRNLKNSPRRVEPGWLSGRLIFSWYLE
jgi:hypothetical protein